MHIFVFHIPEDLKIYKNINLYNLQGLERLNQIIIKNYIVLQINTKKTKLLRQLLNKRLRIEYYLLKNKNEIKNVDNEKKGFNFL